jgi:hypothetical protein
LLAAITVIDRLLGLLLLLLLLLLLQFPKRRIFG